MSTPEEIREKVIEIEVKMREAQDSLENITRLATDINKFDVLCDHKEKVQHTIKEISGYTVRLASDYERFSQLREELMR